MGSDWKSQSLESIASFSQGLQVSVDAQFSNYKNGLSQFIRIVDFTNDAEPPRYIETPSDRYFIESDDIVMIRYGSQTAGKVVRGKSGVLANNMFKISIDVDHIDKGFLFHYLTSPTILNYLTGTQSSSTMPAITFGMLKPIQIQFPGIKQQVRITEIIDSLDNKIELNRRMNETLEGMAQALFKSWFVDFDPVIDNALAAGNPIPEPLAQRAKTRRQAIANGTANRETAQAFPASFRFTEELGWIPEGWEVEVFNHLATLDTSSIKPFEEPETSWEHYSIPAFDSSKMPVWEDGKEIKSNKYKVKEGAILASKLNPETERTWWPFMMEPEKAICSTEFMQFVPHEKEEQTFIYSLIRSDPFQANILERVTGSTGSRQRAKPKEIAEINVIDCGSELREKYVKAVYPCLTLIQNNSLKSQTLAELRDVLLPKLISGKLRIPQAEKMVEEAIA